MLAHVGTRTCMHNAMYMPCTCMCKCVILKFGGVYPRIVYTILVMCVHVHGQVSGLNTQ